MGREMRGWLVGGCVCLMPARLVRDAGPHPFQAEHVPRDSGSEGKVGQITVTNRRALKC